DRIDPAVGLTDIASIGMRADGERPLLRIHARDADAAEAVAAPLRAAFHLTDNRPAVPPLIHERIA
ncbi:MAG: thymidine phosphorylase, partial [Pseudomonadota bacterium]